MGDSLTYGWVVSTGFFDRFIELVAGRFPGARVEGSNHGVPGDTAGGGLARIGKVLEEDPDLVTVQFGLNDLFVGVTLESFLESLAEIVERVREAGAVPVLATSCPVPGELGSGEVGRFYDGIRRLGDRLEVALADLERFWLGRIADERPAGPLYTADGVHPTDLGHALMAEGLFEAVLNS
jgi:acyl-CoA thioesterase-1